MKKLVVSFVSAAALAVIGVAAAGGNTAAVEQQSSDNGNNAAGIFISGNLGYNSAKFDKKDFNSSSVALKEGGFTWNVNAGYQFNQYFAVEGGYTSFADTHATLSGVTSNKITLDGFNANAKGIYPINEQFDLFGKAGVTRLTEKQSIGTGNTALKSTEKKWTPDLGVGAAYNVNDNVALTAQDIYTFKPKGSIPSTNSILAGVSYKFTV